MVITGKNNKSSSDAKTKQIAAADEPEVIKKRNSFARSFRTRSLSTTSLWDMAAERPGSRR